MIQLTFKTGVVGRRGLPELLGLTRGDFGRDLGDFGDLGLFFLGEGGRGGGDLGRGGGDRGRGERGRGDRGRGDRGLILRERSLERLFVRLRVRLRLRLKLRLLLLLFFRSEPPPYNSLKPLWRQL